MALNVVQPPENLRHLNIRSMVLTGRAFIQTRCIAGEGQEVTISCNDWRKVLALLGIEMHGHVTMSTGLLVFDQITATRKMVDAERLRISCATYQDFMENVIMPGLASRGYFVDIRDLDGIGRTFSLERTPGQEMVANSTTGTVRRHHRLIDFGD